MQVFNRTLGLAVALVILPVLMLAGPLVANAQDEAAAFVGSWAADADEGPVTLEFREGGEATGTQAGTTFQIVWAVQGADTLDGVEYTILEMVVIDGPKMYTRALFEGADTLIISEPEARLEDSFSDPITLQRTN